MCLNISYTSFPLTAGFAATLLGMFSAQQERRFNQYHFALGFVMYNSNLMIEITF